MAHKDPFTGVMVADIWEVLKSHELTQVFTVLDSDSKYQIRKLRKKHHALQVINEEINNWNHCTDPEDILPTIDRVVRILEVDFSQSFNGHYMSLSAIVLCGTTYYKALIWSSASYGTYWEPPDGDGDITMTPLRRDL